MIRAIARRAHRRRTISSGVPGVCCVRVQGKGHRPVTVTNLSQASLGRPSPRALKPRLRYKLNHEVVGGVYSGRACVSVAGASCTV